MIRAYKLMWKKWKDFKGKTGVGEFWKATTMNIIVVYVVLLGTLALFVPNDDIIQSTPTLLIFSKIWATIILAFVCVSFVPVISLYIRRLRDTGCSQTSILMLVFGMPFIGGLILTVIKVVGETRREKFLRIIEPYVKEGIIKEVQSFDTASVCLLYDKFSIFFSYTDVKRKSNDLKFYILNGSAGLLEIDLKVGIEKLKDSECKVSPANKEKYRKGSMYLETLKKQDLVVKKFRIAQKLGRYWFASALGVGMWNFLIYIIVLMVTNIDVETYANVIMSTNIAPIAVFVWGLLGVLLAAYVLPRREYLEFATKNDLI